MAAAPHLSSERPLPWTARAGDTAGWALEALSTSPQRRAIACSRLCLRPKTWLAVRDTSVCTPCTETSCAGVGLGPRWCGRFWCLETAVSLEMKLFASTASCFVLIAISFSAPKWKVGTVHAAASTVRPNRGPSARPLRVQQSGLSIETRYSASPRLPRFNSPIAFARQPAPREVLLLRATGVRHHLFLPLFLFPLVFHHFSAVDAWLRLE